MLTTKDAVLLEEKHIAPEQIEAQLSQFKTGFPFLRILQAASLEKGIRKFSESEEKEFIKTWENYLRSDKTVTKFVPASGAASRMFKDLFAFLDADYNVPTTDFEKTFFDNLPRFAFYHSLDETCREIYGRQIPELLEQGEYKTVLRALLMPEGLDYAHLPKGLLLFHSYPEGNRTPVGEHLTEGTLYAKDPLEVVNVHFTVSEEHQELFELLVAARSSGYGQKLDAIFNVTYSVQKSATDTIAVDENNEPLHEDDGLLLFRPGGHGALIENLNDLDSDVVFIKNIDNVVPDSLKENEARYKKLLGGVLIEMQQKAYRYVEKLESQKYTSSDLQEMRRFIEKELCISHAEMKEDTELAAFLLRKLNRPFRVCGMVKNVGEPGGGPFIAENPDGTASPQILESSQIDKNDSRAVTAFKNGSHFNPVDLVCGIKNYKGEKYNLTKYVDKNTGFISQKSKNGKTLKALELPGLWNGAMSDWNTVFVEVPVSTFNPVKTVNDLLRKEHQ